MVIKVIPIHEQYCHNLGKNAAFQFIGFDFTQEVRVAWFKFCLPLIVDAAANPTLQSACTLVYISLFVVISSGCTKHFYQGKIDLGPVELSSYKHDILNAIITKVSQIKL